MGILPGRDVMHGVAMETGYRQTGQVFTNRTSRYVSSDLLAVLASRAERAVNFLAHSVLKSDALHVHFLFLRLG